MKQNLLKNKWYYFNSKEYEIYILPISTFNDSSGVKFVLAIEIRNNETMITKFSLQSYIRMFEEDELVITNKNYFNKISLSKNQKNLIFTTIFNNKKSA